MAAACRFGISSKTALSVSLLFLLLLSTFLLGSPAAVDPSSLKMNVDHKSEEAPTTTCLEKFSICKFTGHFRVKLLGVVIECPRVEVPKLEPTSGGGSLPCVPPAPGTDPKAFAGGIHHPPVSSALIHDAVKKTEGCDCGKGKGAAGTKPESLNRNDEL